MDWDTATEITSKQFCEEPWRWLNLRKLFKISQIFTWIWIHVYQVEVSVSYLGIIIKTKKRILRLYVPLLSISSGQRNLMKTCHNDANTSKITKIASKNFWTFFDKEDRLAKLQKSDFQSHFSMSKIVQIFTKKKIHWRISI